MNTASDAGFWDRSAHKYAATPVADQPAYARTLESTRALLGRQHRVLELGCGTGSTALTLATAVEAYLATDISGEMIAIARDRHAAARVPGLDFRTATAEQLSREALRADVVLGFNYLHLVRDLPGALRCIRDMLAEKGLFITKTPCLGDMNPLLRWALLPAMRAIGKAPFVKVFSASELCDGLVAAGFEILTIESHSGNGKDNRPFIVARRT